VEFHTFLPVGREVVVMLLKDKESDWGAEPAMFARLRGLDCVPKVYGEVVSPDGRKGIVVRCRRLHVSVRHF
jgi:hypothetical protein